MAFSPDGTRLATASEDQTAKVWDVASGRELLTLPAIPMRSLVWPSAPMARAWPRPARIRRPRCGTPRRDGRCSPCQAIPIGSRGVAFSPDGTRLATASMDQTAKVWDVASGREVLTLAGHTAERSLVWPSAPMARAWPPPARDQTAKVWDVASGREVLTLAGHTSWVVGVVFSPDGTRLATASGDQTAKGVGRLVRAGAAHPGRSHRMLVFDVAFSPDGTRLATASEDGTVRVYTLNIEDLMALVRTRMTRSLTSQECQKYLHEERRMSAGNHCSNQVVEGNNLARAGDVDSAVASFEEH